MLSVASGTIFGLPGAFAPAHSQRVEPPVLVVHGCFSHHEHFVEFARRFAAAGFDTYAVSLRGRLGTPPANARGLRARDYLEDLVGCIGRMGTPPVVVGHSLGGLLALKAAEQDLCRAVVVLNPAPPGILTAQPRSLPFFAPSLPAIVRGAPFRPSSRSMRFLALNAVTADAFDELIDSMVPESGLVFQEMMLGAIRVARSRIRCPVLCVGGIDDRVISPRLVRYTARCTGGDVEMLDGHGHWIHGEPGADRVVQCVISWLGSRIASSMPVAQPSPR